MLNKPSISIPRGQSVRNISIVRSPMEVQMCMSPDSGSSRDNDPCMSPLSNKPQQSARVDDNQTMKNLVESLTPKTSSKNQKSLKKVLGKLLDKNVTNKQY